MESKRLTPDLSVAWQIFPADLVHIAQAGFRAVICNRPDGEGVDQPNFAEIEAAAHAAGLEAHDLPVVSGKVSDENAAAFGVARAALPKPLLAYCRTGMRSATLWSFDEGARGRPLREILSTARAAGYDLSGVVGRIAAGGRSRKASADLFHSVVVIGGGAGGIAVAASLKARKPDLDIALIEPADVHYYQPGWTMVGGGIFSPAVTARTMASLIPTGVCWIKDAVAAFEPDRNTVILEGHQTVRYDRLVVAPGLTLDWAGVAGLTETLGRNGVTSNYRYDLAPYTWELVQTLRAGRALFTQPPMPIKCAGAPQKAMYLSADHWLRQGRLKDIDVEYYTVSPALFGVEDYVPALMTYVNRYDARLNFRHTLTRIDGPAKRAWFSRQTETGICETIETDFDMIHVVPPQQAPDFIRASPLADVAGWIAVDPASLRHARFPAIYALGDAIGASNAKTAAAARKQAPVVAHNLLVEMGHLRGAEVAYDGYGSCALTVERGKILLAEFGYGGTLMPSFPAWLIDGTKLSRVAWLLKERMLPPLYWKAMLKGREWMAKPQRAERTA